MEGRGEFGGGGGRSEHRVGYPTLPYGVKVEGRGEVGVGVNIGWVILPLPTLPYGVQVGY